MSVRTIDFSSTAYAKTKSFKAKENLATAAKLKEKRALENQSSGVKSSWTPLKADLNEKLFDERKELLSNWFDRWTDAQRRAVLEILISKCKSSQLQYTFSLIDDRIPITHVDFTRKLPRVISVYIMSFLDPRSLCRCAQVCWFWRYLSELDHIWMPKCFKFGWLLPFVPSPFEHGVWKRHYLECVKGLQYVKPKSPPGSPHLSQGAVRSVVRSQSQGSLFKKTNKAIKTTDTPPWRGPDPHPNDIKRKFSKDGPIGGCRRCHMSTHATDSEASEDHHTKKGAGKSGKPRIRPATASFAPESEATGTKFNTRTGRPDWAVQSAIVPVAANRPPPPELRTSAQSLGNARGSRNPPAEELFQSQPWKTALDYESD